MDDPTPAERRTRRTRSSRAKHREPWEVAAFDRWYWLSLYAAYQPFTEDLRQFYSDYFEPALPHLERARFNALTFDDTQYVHELRQGPGSDWDYHLPDAVEVYRRETQGFCARWALDQLYPVALVPQLVQARTAQERAEIFNGSKPDGCEEVHFWCRNQAGGWGFFACGRPITGWAIQLGEPEVISVHEHHDARTRYLFIDRSGAPSLHLPSVADSWHPAWESRQEAEKRILGRVREQLRAELDRIQAQAEEAGLVARPKQSALRRHMEWAFLHLAVGLTYPEIADKHRRLTGEDRNPVAIAEAVSDLAPYLAIRL